MAVLALAVVVVSLLESRGAAREDELLEYVSDSRTEPLSLVRELARSRSILILGDVAGAPGPKRLAADAIEALARGPGLDWVALEVGSDMQPWIDRYLDGDEDDAAGLLSHSRAVRASEGTSVEYLGLYRRVRALNGELGVNRRIRILALDSPDWPPAAALSPSRVLPRFAARDSLMLERVTPLFRDDERTRILVFADGLRTLNAGLDVSTGGAATAAVEPLARRLRRLQPGRVASILVDAPATAAGSVWLGYRPGRLSRVLRSVSGGQALGFRLLAPFPESADNLEFTAPPGLAVRLVTAGQPLSAVVDAYIRLAD